MDEQTLARILAAPPPADPIYRPRLASIGSAPSTVHGAVEPLRLLMIVAASLVLVALLAFGAFLGTGILQAPATPMPSSPTSTVDHVTIPEEPGEGPVQLTFPTANGTVTNDPQYELTTAFPNSLEIAVWWRVGWVSGDPCASTPDPLRAMTDPSPTEAYDLIRTAPIFDTSTEAPFTFAGATGRAVDIVLRADARPGCVAMLRSEGFADAENGSVLLTGAGRGYAAGHIRLSVNGALRVGAVNVSGHDLLVAINAASKASLADANTFLASLEAHAGTPERQPSPEPSVAGRFDIGSRSLYMTCSGSGSPTIVLDGGAGNDTSTWDAVFPSLTRIGRVCAYDRANIGRSDAAPTPRTLADTVHDPHAVLAAERTKPPYVLVGHSFGGLDVRMYDAVYPDDVAGIVLVDATPAEFVDIAKACARLSPAACNSLKLGIDNSEAVAPSAADLASIEESTPTVPARVLYAGDHGDPSATGIEINTLAAALQTELHASWGRASPVFARASGHYIQDDQPTLVVQAVADVVRAARLSP